MDSQSSYLQLTTACVNGHQVITVTGEVDLCTSPTLHDYLQNVSATTLGTGTRGGDLVLDLRALTFMNSSGLRVLFQADQRACRIGGRLRLTALTMPITRLLTLMHLDAHFDIYPTLTAATTTSPAARHHRARTGDGARPPQRTPREQPARARTGGLAAPRQRRRCRLLRLVLGPVRLGQSGHYLAEPVEIGERPDRVPLGGQPGLVQHLPPADRPRRQRDPR
jgi:anti-sigma B factor antagonist